jgi:hypothetical protein
MSQVFSSNTMKMTINSDIYLNKPEAGNKMLSNHFERDDLSQNQADNGLNCLIPEPSH